MARDVLVHLTDDDEAALALFGLTPEDAFGQFLESTRRNALAERVTEAQEKLKQVPEVARAKILTDYKNAIDAAVDL